MSTAAMPRAPARALAVGQTSLHGCDSTLVTFALRSLETCRQTPVMPMAMITKMRRALSEESPFVPAYFSSTMEMPYMMVDSTIHQKPPRPPVLRAAAVSLGNSSSSALDIRKTPTIMTAHARPCMRVIFSPRATQKKMLTKMMFAQTNAWFAPAFTWSAEKLKFAKTCANPIAKPAAALNTGSVHENIHINNHSWRYAVEKMYREQWTSTAMQPIIKNKIGICCWGSQRYLEE
mmetsp:Transcript_15780/g.28756  ORF Transcript_15780/g.28756 Transcript_15780/m.28756 type:complete len:234 (+) Transcript_15780:383-1084(+)